MKISASVFAQNQKSFSEISADMDKIGAHYLHIDCKSSHSFTDFLASYFPEVTLPLDVHLIFEDIPNFDSKLLYNPENRVCIQFEEIKSSPSLFFDYPIQKGIALSTQTPLSSLPIEWIEKINFLMLMCTIPGESGGAFDKSNFQRINQLKALYPKLSITIDGGVNSEVAFVLKLLGIDTVVSGSYLMQRNDYGVNMLSLLHPIATDNFVVSDFMLPLDTCPRLVSGAFTFKECIEAIDLGGKGFVLVTNEDGILEGVVTNADMRKAILSNWGYLENLKTNQYINPHPFVIDEKLTVKQMLKTIEDAGKVILFLPVIDEENRLKGLVPLNNLAKG